jgi:hypothetical protein
LRQAVWVKDGAGQVLSNAVSAPDPGWFTSVTPPAAQGVGDIGAFLHIRDASIRQVIDQGTSAIPGLPDPFLDFNGHRRPHGKAIDIGAVEFSNLPTAHH